MTVRVFLLRVLSCLMGGQLVLLLPSRLLSSHLWLVNRSLHAAAGLLALAALGAQRWGEVDIISAGGRRGAQHLDASNRVHGEQAPDLLLGVKGEVAEQVLVVRAGSTRHIGGQAAPLILEQHIGSRQSSFLHLQADSSTIQ